MALGWFNHLAGDRAIAWSGGSEPATEINPSAVTVRPIRDEIGARVRGLLHELGVTVV